MRQMQDSGVEWIGTIPREWTTAMLGKIACIQTGNTPSKGEQCTYYSDESGIPWIKAEDLGTNNSIEITSEYLTLDGIKHARIFAPNTVFVCCIASVGKVGFSKLSCSCNQQINGISFGSTYFWKYGFYVSKAQEEEYLLHASGNVMKIINSDTQSRLVCPFPPFAEQNRIAGFLDSECALIDIIIEKTRASIEEYKKLKQAIITQAVTKGVRGDRLMKDSGIEWVGEMPRDWDSYRIAALYAERNEAGNDQLPVLTVSINTGVSDRELSDDEQARVFVRSEDRSKYMRVYPGDLTYNMMRAWQGAFGAVRVDGMVSPAYVIAMPKREIDSRYMEALLRTPAAKEEMKRYSYGIADFRLRLYWDYFKTMKVCLPPLKEQHEIADYLDIKNQEIDQLIEKKEQFMKELESYKKSMIYEYVTGKKEVI